MSKIFNTYLTRSNLRGGIRCRTSSRTSSRVHGGGHVSHRSDPWTIWVGFWSIAAMREQTYKFHNTTTGGGRKLNQQERSKEDNAWPNPP